jgi:DNA-binding MarR family transcriptional regulator
MTDADLAEHLSHLIAAGFMETVQLPDGRINHVLTPKGEEAKAEVIWRETRACVQWLRDARGTGG